MKLTAIMLLVALMQVTASVYSQSKLLTLKINNTSIESALKEIEKQSEFFFLYNNKQIDVTQKIDISVKNKLLEEVLATMLEGTGIHYLIKDRQIVLYSEDDLRSVVNAIGESQVIQQQKSVSGKVTDSYNQPLPGVTVVIKGTTQGTVTNTDGEYILANIPDDATLVFSFVGMRTQEVTVGSQTTINIVMEEEMIGIEEVVAVGYGVQKKVNLTGAISSVTSKELEARPITNMTNALSGLASGIQINQGSGQPGRDNATLRIRGIGTLGNADPLILVDGIESSMSDIRPENVESISVLKDAAAAAIYGSRAANGVLLITTKKGTKGKNKVSYHGYVGVQNATRMESYITDFATYMELNNEANRNVGLGDYYTQEEIDTWQNQTDPVRYPNIDWVDKVYGNNAVLQSHNLSFTGGSENNLFYFSLGYTNQEGLVPTNEMKRYNIRFNWESNLTKKFKIGTNLSGSWTDIVDPANTEVFGIVPGIPWEQNEDGRWGGNQSNGTGTVRNPRADWTNNTNTERTQRFLGRVFIDWNISNSLTFNSNVALRFYNSLVDFFQAKYDLWNFNNDAIVRTLGDPQTMRNTNEENYTITSYQTLNYQKSFAEKHNISLLGGYSVEAYRNDQFRASIRKFHNNEIRVLDGGQENPQVGGSASEWSLMSSFGRLNYDYNSKYLVEANLRYDGSSRFREGKKWGLFPSFSAGWRISEEELMKDFDWLDNLKVRASWGKLGNQDIGTYPYQSVYALNQNYNFGGNIVPGIAQTAVANSDIEWETTTTSNLGIDITVLKGKINFTADYFSRLTDGILVQLPIPKTLGDKAAPYQNLAEVKNRGWESSGTYSDKIGELNFSLGLNITQVENEVSKYLGDVPFYSGPFIIREGLPMYSIYGYEHTGIIRSQSELDELNAYARTTSGNNNAYFITNKTSPGDLKYKDQLTVDTNGDGIPDASDGVINSDDRAVIGNTIPKYMYGINLYADYKGFDLNILLQGVKDVDAYLSGAGVMPFGVNGDRGQTPAKWEKRWTTDNPDAALPRLTNNRGYNWNDQTSTFWMQDGSFLRLKNLQFGYNLPETIINSVNIEKARLYLNGENLFTWTKFDGWDPERKQRDTEINYPNLKTVTLGVQIMF